MKLFVSGHQQLIANEGLSDDLAASDLFKPVLDMPPELLYSLISMLLPPGDHAGIPLIFPVRKGNQPHACSFHIIIDKIHRHRYSLVGLHHLMAQAEPAGLEHHIRLKARRKAFVHDQMIDDKLAALDIERLPLQIPDGDTRSEERRVGKECRL